MITFLTETIRRAVTLTLERSQLLYILLLLFGIPLALTFLFQNFFNVAAEQIDVGMKQMITHEHSSLATIVTSGLATSSISGLLESEVKDSKLYRKIIIARETDDKIFVEAASDTNLLHTDVSAGGLYQSAIAHENDTLIYPFSRNGERVWLTYRSFTVNGDRWYIHTELNLASLDAQTSRLTTGTYIIMFLVVITMLGLVWWLWRQQDYKFLLKENESRLREHFDFTNMMAHELRAPLTAISGYLSMLNEGDALSASQKMFVERSSKSTNRLIRLVNDFLEVARIQAGTLKVNFERQDVGDTVAAVIASMGSVAEAKGLRLESLVPKTPIIINTDPDRLEQVLTNMVSNAIKYTEAGSVTVSLGERGEEIELRVQDTGRGISATDQYKLFTPFTRVGRADQSGEVGSGLGLWITKHIVELLKGSITIESIEGVGTHIIVHLPRT